MFHCHLSFLIVNVSAFERWLISALIYLLENQNLIILRLLELQRKELYCGE